jgi:hypothetical protein
MSLYFFNKDDLYKSAEKKHGAYLGEYGAKNSLNESVKSQKDNLNKRYDIFLSHSSQDARIIWGIKNELEARGNSVYVDWIDDAQLDRSRVTKETANLLRQRMKRCSSLIYVFTSNAKQSKWMPWELGYFDGFRGKVAVLPVLDSMTDTYIGVEFVGLYPVVKYNSSFTDLEVRESEYHSKGMNNWILNN